MIGYQVDQKAMTAAFKANLRLFGGLDQVIETGLNVAGKRAVTIIKDRIKRKGVSADGEVLFTRSRTPIGAYGQRHGTARRERRLQTRRVDLTFTGKMFDNFGVIVLQKNFVEIGFFLLSEAEKMEELEAYYGADILTVSDDEEAEAVGKLEEKVFDTLNKLFT